MIIPQKRIFPSIIPEFLFDVQQQYNLSQSQAHYVE
jgi:hypothetical protein